VASGSAGLAHRIEKQASTTQQFKTCLSRYFYFCMSLVMTALVLWGFSRTLSGSLFHGNPPRPLLLWIHAAAFSTWMLFFIAQSALVLARKVSIHRLLGWFGAGLAVAMVLLGLEIAVVMARFDAVVLHQSGTDAFLAIPFGDIIMFGSCMAMAIYWRRKPEYHRRLVFIATCLLMDAPLDRFDFMFDHNLSFPVLDCLILLGMTRDWLVDGRVHKVYLYALPALIIAQSLAMYAWRANPRSWQMITRSILRW
jgi:hypothetical protein